MSMSDVHSEHTTSLLNSTSHGVLPSTAATSLLASIRGTIQDSAFRCRTALVWVHTSTAAGSAAQEQALVVMDSLGGTRSCNIHDSSHRYCRSGCRGAGEARQS